MSVSGTCIPVVLLRRKWLFSVSFNTHCIKKKKGCFPHSLRNYLAEDITGESLAYGCGCKPHSTLGGDFPEILIIEVLCYKITAKHLQVQFATEEGIWVGARAVEAGKPAGEGCRQNPAAKTLRLSLTCWKERDCPGQQPWSKEPLF